MKDFMEAMSIFQKYMKEDVSNPFHCEHETMYFFGINNPEYMSEEDLSRLDDLGFFVGEGGFISDRFGGC